MDKYEYNLKLDQMKSCLAEENYEAAAEIADSINWNKIKNVNALVKAGEVYDKAERYADSREVLLLAYDRSPIGRMIIYKLAEVAIKMGDFTAAEEYYDEFVKIAPHDNLRYVLRYNIRKNQGASYDEIISILEEFKDQEYTEEWAYELAYLYHKNGNVEKCIDACDELILWFGDGPYVERALELKMCYQPLTKIQEEKYRKFRLEKEGYTEISAEEMEKAGETVHPSVVIPKVDINPEKFNTVNLQEEIAKGMQQIMQATEKETVSDTMDSIKKIVEEIPYLQIPREESETPETAHIETDEEIDGSLKINFQEMLGEESDGQISLVMDEKAQVEKQITGQMSIQDILDEWEKTRRAAEAALQEAEQRKLESAKARALIEAEDIMERLNDVIPKLDAGVSPKELLEEEYLQGGENSSTMRELKAPDVDIPILEPVAPVAGVVAPEIKLPEVEISEIELPEIELPEIDMSDIEAPEEKAEEEEKLPEIELPEIEMPDIDVPEEKAEKEKLPEIELPENELPDIEVSEEKIEEEKLPEIEMPQEDENRLEEQLLEEEIYRADSIDIDTDSADEISEMDTANEEVSEIEVPEITLPEIEEPEEEKVAVSKQDKIAMAETRRMPVIKQSRIPEIAIPEDLDLSDEEIEVPVIEELSDEQKAIFSYFVPVKGMEDQLCRAINSLSAKLANKGSEGTGNLIIQGEQGCGKTVLATSLIKVLQLDGGKPSGKVGKIDAAALNNKDPQQLLRKVAGGCLIIEKAGDINRSTAVALALLMAHDTNGTLIILEDTSKGIKRALAQDDGFAKQFQNKISVPIFTNDELVSFARSYSNELGYEIEEMAVLALYNRISNIQRLDQATTLTEVKEIVDEAIEREAHGGLKKAISILTAKRYTEDDKIVLTERNFEEI